MTIDDLQLGDKVEVPVPGVEDEYLEGAVTNWEKVDGEVVVHFTTADGAQHVTSLADILFVNDKGAPPEWLVFKKRKRQK